MLLRDEDNVTYMPVWKIGASAEERLQELAMIARKHPERFKNFAIAYQQEIPGPAGSRFPTTMTRYALSDGISATTAVGLFEIAKAELLRHTYDF